MLMLTARKGRRFGRCCTYCTSFRRMVGRCIPCSIAAWSGCHGYRFARLRQPLQGDVPSIGPFQFDFVIACRETEETLTRSFSPFSVKEMSIGVLKALFSDFLPLACVYSVLQVLVAESVERRALPFEDHACIAGGGPQSSPPAVEKFTTGTLMRDNGSRDRERDA